MHKMNQDVLVLLFCACSVLLSACSHTAERTVTLPNVKDAPMQVTGDKHVKSRRLLGQQIAALAKSQHGKPYRYGGASPAGFDCSGLVYYTHINLGLRVPRVSHQQYQFAQPITLSKLELGDTVFFTLTGNKVSHVGIYIGNGQFVHAPKTGKFVSTNHLNEPFWKARIVGGGRLY